MRRKHVERITCERFDKINRAENFNDDLLSPSIPIPSFSSHFIAATDVPSISEKEENEIKKTTTRHKIVRGTRTIRVYGKIKRRPNSPYCTIAGCVRKVGSFFPKCKSHWGKEINFTRNKRDQICRSTGFVSAGTVLQFLYSASGTKKSSEVEKYPISTNNWRLAKIPSLIPLLRGFPSIRLDSSGDPKNLPARYFGLSATNYNLELIPFSGGKLYKRVLLTKERYIIEEKDKDEEEEEEEEEEAPVASILYCCPILTVCDIYEKGELILKSS